MKYSLLSCLPTYAVTQGGGLFSDSPLVSRALGTQGGACHVGVEVGGAPAASSNLTVSVNGVVGARRARSCGTQTDQSVIKAIFVFVSFIA